MNKAIDILSPSPCISAQHKSIILYPSFSAYGSLQLPNDIQGTYNAIYDKAPSSATLMHLKCKLIHSTYELILNSNFMESYKDGVIVTCYNGIQ